MTILNAITTSSVQQQPAPVPLVPNGSASGGLSFGDVLDAVNPLQHIPVVSSVYRTLTGSTISTTSQIAGDAAYGLVLGGGTLASALIGAAPGVAETAVQDVTGTNITSSVVNAIAGGTSPTSSNNGQAVADPNAVPVAPVNTQTNTAPNLFAADKHPAVTAAQYHKAVVQDSVNKMLMQI